VNKSCQYIHESCSKTCKTIKVTLSLCLYNYVLRHDVWRSGCITPQFLTSAQHGGAWSASRPCRSASWERTPGTHWIGGWAGPRAGLYSMERRTLSCPFWESNPGRWAPSRSLYRLSYPCNFMLAMTVWCHVSLVWVELKIFNSIFMSLAVKRCVSLMLNSLLVKWMSTCKVALCN
jgi:hypothetical protein